MANITDKFGKASAPDAYAPATTVRSVKNVGESTIDAFDLDKFDDTVPLFFLTYKKTTNPETGATIKINQCGWKGLVNKDSNTITNLVLAPGYTDPGQAVGDYIEATPTSFWANELVDGILVSHNPDGTLKPKVVLPASINGGGNGVLQSDADGNTTVAPVTADNVDFKTVTGAIDISTVGVKTVNLGFKPALIELIGQFPYLTDAARTSVGGFTSDSQWCAISLAWSGGNLTSSDSNTVVWSVDGSGITTSEVIKGGITDTGFSINVTKRSSDISKVRYIAHPV